MANEHANDPRILELKAMATLLEVNVYMWHLPHDDGSFAMWVKERNYDCSDIVEREIGKFCRKSRSRLLGMAKCKSTT